jgi:prophage antirepressor-like protein
MGPARRDRSTCLFTCLWQDVCDALEICDKNRASRIPDEFKERVCVQTVTRGKQTLIFCDEGGLNWLLMSCRSCSEMVRRFKMWVCKEVLPSIRKTGKYSVPKCQQETISDRAHQQWLIDNKFKRIQVAKDAIAMFPDDGELKLMYIENAKNILGKRQRDDAPTLLTSISEAMERAGYGSGFARKHRSVAGRAAAKAFRRLFPGVSFSKRTQNIDGRPGQVNAYTADQLRAVWPAVEAKLDTKEPHRTTKRRMIATTDYSSESTGSE